MTTPATNPSGRRASDGKGSSEGEGNNGSVRKRGRPRVEHPAQCATERRRTQIRMAQRAYRQRKEGAMDELKTQVSELTRTIDNMNKAFEDCRTSLVSGGLLASQARELENVSASYKQWIGAIRSSGDSDSTESDRNSQEVSMGASPPPYATSTAPIPNHSNLPAWIDQGAIQQAAALPHIDASLGYQYLTEENPRMGVARGTSSMVMPNPSTRYRKYQDTGALDGLRMNYPMRMFLRGLDPPKTYSYQEPTFARRVHRACMETLYEAVMEYDRHPQAIEGVMQLSFLSKDPNKLAPNLRMILDRGPSENLDGGIGTSIHIGGAGAHYPRADPVDQLQSRPPGTYVGVVTLETLNLLHSSMEEHISLDVAGFEGQWFDPYDVEGYLNEKGIHVDPGATFVEADLTRLSSGSSEASSRSTSTPSLALSDRQLLSGQILPQQRDLSDDSTVWEDMLGSDALAFGSVGFSDTTGSWMNFMPSRQPSRPISSASPPQGMVSGSIFGQYSADSTFDNAGPAGTSQFMIPEPQRRPSVIDVSKFVRDLVVSGMCLGRAPGFRREDVDRCLTNAVVEAF